MSEILLQTIVEKLESLEITLLKPPVVGKDDLLQQSLLKEIKAFQSDIAKLPARFIENEEKFDKLIEIVNALNLKSSEAVQGAKSVEQIVEKGTTEIKRLIEISSKRNQFDNIKVFLESDAKKWLVILLIAFSFLTYLYNIGIHWMESHR